MDIVGGGSVASPAVAGSGSVWATGNLIRVDDQGRRRRKVDHHGRRGRATDYRKVQYSLVADEHCRRLDLPGHIRLDVRTQEAEQR